ncbi:MAG TPA: lysylphosphatidylglycerol synthase domain-containing protein [Bacteroidia bacterium]|jgi:hypothetical protein|nr:lysylphosphatidylglycerol synthase domain-containing protein [Bacteroidia bacterium]
MKSIPHPFLRKLSWFIKIAIVIAAAFYIYQKIARRSDLSLFMEHFNESLRNHVCLFLGVFIMLFVNWGLEAWKWKLLVSHLYPISFGRACRAVLAGVTTGIFTPNRAGEFGGRVFDLPRDIRVQAALLSFTGGFVQLGVTVVAALPAVFICSSCDVFMRSHLWLSLILISGLIITMIVLWLLKERIAPRATEYFRLFQSYSALHWMKIASISVLRYLVFSTQFFLLLYAFGIRAEIPEVFSAIALTFFATTVIPTFALSEIGIRGSVSVIFLGMYSTDTAAILASSFLLWIINIALPALTGIVFVLQLDSITKAKK